MKATAGKVIIYDNTCPMCALYTNAFVKSGMLGKQGRLPFAELTDPNIISSLDLCRAKHEIPLIDTQGGETLYGMDSLVFILGERFPFIKGAMKIRPIDYFFRRLYKMISYNRRIIIPRTPASKGIDCSPDFNFKYRMVFIGFALIVSTLVTYFFGRSVAHYINDDAQTTGWQMLLVAGTGWLMQIGAAILFMKEKKIDYIGHLGVVMILGVLLLLPGMLIGALTGHSSWLVPAVSVLISSGTMLWQQVKRTKHLHISQGWTMLWFLFLQSTAFTCTYVFYLKNV
jgi:hypothetical protein